MPELTDYLKSRGFDVEPLTRPAADRLFSAWCETFLSEVRRTKGCYRYLGFHWHAYSYNLVPALDGEAALDAYTRLSAQDVVVIPESWSGGCGVRCRGPSLPRFVDYRDDLYVFPESLDWSMAFTHEHPWLGPYFALSVQGRSRVGPGL